MAGMLEDSLLRCKEQFTWTPHIEQSERLRKYDHFVVCGMGGSHLGAWFLQAYEEAPITIHRDYGLPQVSENTLVILSSYSGNTEEVLDAGRTALERNIPVAALTTGGTLLAWAREHRIPLLVMPEKGLEPRHAVPLSMIGLAALMMDAELLHRIYEAAENLAEPQTLKATGAEMALFLQGKTPIIYAPAPLESLAYVWKIKCNETAKVPAFMNLLPEMCHNELQSYDRGEAVKTLTQDFAVIFLGYESQHPRISTRIDAASAILREKGVPLATRILHDKTLARVLEESLIADWASLQLAHAYGVADAQTPLIAEFKHRIAPIS